MSCSGSWKLTFYLFIFKFLVMHHYLGFSFLEILGDGFSLFVFPIKELSIYATMIVIIYCRNWWLLHSLLAAGLKTFTTFVSLILKIFSDLYYVNDVLIKYSGRVWLAFSSRLERLKYDLASKGGWGSTTSSLTECPFFHDRCLCYLVMMMWLWMEVFVWYRKEAR